MVNEQYFSGIRHFRLELVRDAGRQPLHKRFGSGDQKAACATQAVSGSTISAAGAIAAP